MKNQLTKLLGHVFIYETLTEILYNVGSLKSNDILTYAAADFVLNFITELGVYDRTTPNVF